MKSPINPIIVSIMDWVPFVFIDDVCHQMKLETFQEVSELSDTWSPFGTKHGEKRRELAFLCRVDGKESSYSIEDRNSRTELVVADLNLEFDRITQVWCIITDQLRNRITLEELNRDVLPTVASLAANCEWLNAFNPIFFEAFKNCPGLNKIIVQEQGEESRDFVTRQVQLGNVQRLTLYGTGGWPEAEILPKTLETFVKSARFNELTYRGVLPNDAELFELFLERALAGELKLGARISLNNITFAKSQNLIRSLCPECREASKEIAWRIPNSNRRVAVEQCNGTFSMEVRRI